MTMSQRTPAVAAAENAQRMIETCINEGRHFLVEAGAGAGKTYSLVASLKYVIGARGRELQRANQQIACITYTNVAAEEILSRIDKSPRVHCSTIHAFCWALIRDYQSPIREMLPTLSGWESRISEMGPVGGKRVEYNLGFPRIEPDRVLLHHNDVLRITVNLLSYAKFRFRLASQFPVLFIDEYQDTDRDLAIAIEQHILESSDGPMVGLFGDSWQKIYATGCGTIQSDRLTVIERRANFRSCRAIVKVLNRIRPQLPQEINDPETSGTAHVYHTNDWPGARREDSRWQGDLPPDAAEAHLAYLRNQLEREGWNFDPKCTKILMLTHRVLAQHQGYGEIAEVFSGSESFVERTDPYMSFLVDVVEPMCVAYVERRYGDMFSLAGASAPRISSASDKIRWSQDLAAILEARSVGTVGNVIDVIAKSQCFHLPENVVQRESIHRGGVTETLAKGPIIDPGQIERIRSIRYSEVIALTRYVQSATPFATKHGVKGAEFENVLVVVGRAGWNMYNFERYLELADGTIVPSRDAALYERTRNLFYVACSRPVRRLAVLFLQRLSQSATSTLKHWFGETEVHSLTIPSTFGRA